MAMMEERRSQAGRDTSWSIRWDSCSKSSSIASLPDRQGVKLLLLPVKGVFAPMKKVWLDTAYCGKGQEWIEQEMGWEAEIVKHIWTGLRGVWVPKGTKVNWEEIIPPGFHVLPRRWVVERTFA